MPSKGADLRPGKRELGVGNRTFLAPQRSAGGLQLWPVQHQGGSRQRVRAGTSGESLVLVGGDGGGLLGLEELHATSLQCRLRLQHPELIVCGIQAEQDLTGGDSSAALQSRVHPDDAPADLWGKIDLGDRAHDARTVHGDGPNPRCHRRRLHKGNARWWIAPLRLGCKRHQQSGKSEEPGEYRGGDEESLSSRHPCIRSAILDGVPLPTALRPASYLWRYEPA